MIFRAQFIPAVLLLLLAGCSSAPKARQSEDRPPDINITETPAIVRPPQPVPAPKPAPPVPREAYTIPPETWVPLDRWARSNHLGSISNLNFSATPTFSLTTPAGPFVVRTGSLLAQWAGLELRLGFAPRLIGGEPFLHQMDLQKNLLPLLCAPPTPSPGPRVIVLDPGHGGKDSGSRSVTGQLEKNFTLDWGNRLKILLEARGWQVFLTRTNDTEVSLPARVEFADARHADLFFSLHFNATTGNGHAGIETYCVTPTGMPSSVTRNYEDNTALVFPNNHYDALNLQLALRIHREVLAATGGQDRGVRRARFLTVLRGQNRPAVLVEGGYLSNAQEASLIETPEHRQKLAEAVAKALE